MPKLNAESITLAYLSWLAVLSKPNALNAKYDLYVNKLSIVCVVILF